MNGHLSIFIQRGVRADDAMRVLVAMTYASQRTRVSLGDMLSGARGQHASCARKLAMHTAAQMRVSMADIARAMGRHHTTVMSAVRAIEARQAQ